MKKSTYSTSKYYSILSNDENNLSIQTKKWLSRRRMSHVELTNLNYADVFLKSKESKNRSMKMDVERVTYIEYVQEPLSTSRKICA